MSYRPTFPLRILPDQSGAMVGEKKMVLTDDVSFYTERQQPPCSYSSVNGKIEPMPDGKTKITMFVGFTGDYPPYKGIDLAAVPHDFVYGDAEQIAKAWGWSIEHVLDWGNQIFRDRMEELDADPVKASVCYDLVNAFGCDYHEVKRVGFWSWLRDEIGERLSTPPPKIGAEP